MIALKYKCGQEEMSDYAREMIGGEIEKEGWNVYNMKREFQRQGCTSELFRKITCWKRGDDDKEVNTICSTYPEFVLVPEGFEVNLVQLSSKFRTKNRFPALSYYSQKYGTSIWRSSQTNQGIFGDRSDEDETLVEAI